MILIQRTPGGFGERKDRVLVLSEGGYPDHWATIPLGTIATRIASRQVMDKQVTTVMLPSGEQVITSGEIWAEVR